jgi:hypothetical protein
VILLNIAYHGDDYVRWLLEAGFQGIKVTRPRSTFGKMLLTGQLNDDCAVASPVGQSRGDSTSGTCRRLVLLPPTGACVDDDFASRAAPPPEADGRTLMARFRPT